MGQQTDADTFFTPRSKIPVYEVLELNIIHPSVRLLQWTKNLEHLQLPQAWALWSTVGRTCDGATMAHIEFPWSHSCSMPLWRWKFHIICVPISQTPVHRQLEAGHWKLDESGQPNISPWPSDLHKKVTSSSGTTPPTLLACLLDQEVHS
jgi:hypothetical protein